MPSRREPVVGKRIQVIDNRTMLIESVEHAAILPELNNLPAPDQAATGQPNRGKVLAQTSRQDALRAQPSARPIHRATAPARRMAALGSPAAAGGRARLLAALAAPTVVIDYTLSGSLSDFTFDGFNTFLISDWVELYGTTTFEGNTVVKIQPQPAQACLDFAGNSIVCLTEAIAPPSSPPETMTVWANRSVTPAILACSTGVGSWKCRAIRCGTSAFPTAAAVRLQEKPSPTPSMWRIASFSIAGWAWGALISGRPMPTTF